MRTNTELHGIPQRRIRTFYFFWNTPTVPKLTWKMENSKSFSDYLKEIPKRATQQNMFKTTGVASERFRPYQFCLQREKMTHRWVKEVFFKDVSGLKIHQDLFTVQVNLCQKLFFLHNMGRTCCVQKLFWMSETISLQKMFSPGLSLEFSCIELVIQWTICRHIVG